MKAQGLCMINTKGCSSAGRSFAQGLPSFLASSSCFSGASASSRQVVTFLVLPLLLTIGAGGLGCGCCWTWGVVGLGVVELVG